MLWGTFSLVHVITLIISVAIIIGLYFILKNRSERTQTVVLFILSLSGIAAIIFNLVRWGSPIEYLPFHMCSITAMLLPFAVITKSKIINNLLVLWGLGALIALVVNHAQADYEVFSVAFAFYYLPHTFEVGVPVLLFALGHVKKEVKYIGSTLALTVFFYTVVHFINLALNEYAVANNVVDWAGEVVKLNYMYSMAPANPLLQFMYDLVPLPYWYMFVITPPIALYLVIMYLPEIAGGIKKRKKGRA